MLSIPVIDTARMVAIIDPGEPIGLYGYIDMALPSLVTIRGHDWGQNLIGFCYDNKFHKIGSRNIYYNLDITEGGVITNTVHNTLYITQIY